MAARIAAKVDAVDQDYFSTWIEPMFDHPLVEFLGEVGEDGAPGAQREGHREDVVSHRPVHEQVRRVTPRRSQRRSQPKSPHDHSGERE